MTDPELPFPIPFGEAEYPAALAHTRSDLISALERLDDRPPDELRAVALMYMFIYADAYFDLAYNAWTASDPPVRSSLTTAMTLIVTTDAPWKVREAFSLLTMHDADKPAFNPLDAAIDAVREWCLDETAATVTALRLLTDTADLVFAWIESHAPLWGDDAFRAPPIELFTPGIETIGREAFAQAQTHGSSVKVVYDLLLVPTDET